MDMRTQGRWSVIGWLFLSRARSFGMQALILSPAQRQSSLWVHGKVKTTSLHWGKREDLMEYLFLFHPSVFLGTSSMEKCGNWGSAVICHVGLEPPAFPLRVCEGCLFPGYWSCQGQNSVRASWSCHLQLYIRSRLWCRFWCQELFWNNWRK